MSLVNDLLIELDRQREPEGESPSATLRGLRPNRRSGCSRRRGWLASGATLIACVAFVGAGLAGVFASPTPTSPPAVAARPLASTSDPDPALALGDAIAPDTLERAQFARVVRPPSIRSVTIERRAGATRLRIDGEAGLLHRIRPDSAADAIELIFAEAGLGTALAPLDLIDTPIRTLSTERLGDGLHLRLDLEPGTRVQRQSLESAEGTLVLLDLRAPRDAAEPTTRLDREDEPIAAAEPRAPASSQVASRSLEIAPSGADRLRRDREESWRRAQTEVELARNAARAGDLQIAGERYQAALTLEPDHREALAEWAQLLVESGRVEDAIGWVARAREGAADPQLTVLHARLVGSAGRIDEAIRILERSGATLTQAPEVHALTAAFLQRAGRHDEAIARYEAIVRRYPGESRWWLGLGISLDAVARHVEALDVYRIAMQIGTLSRPSQKWVSSRVETLDAEG